MEEARALVLETADQLEVKSDPIVGPHVEYPAFNEADRLYREACEAFSANPGDETARAVGVAADKAYWVARECSRLEWNAGRYGSAQEYTSVQSLYLYIDYEYGGSTSWTCPETGLGTEVVAPNYKVLCAHCGQPASRKGGAS